MGIFDNAKEVRINDKKVKSIVSTEGNMTLYLNATLVRPSSLVLQNMSNSSVTYGTTVQLVATYDESDGEISNQTVTLYDNDVQITTGTTDSNGEVTFNLTSLSIGSHSFKAECNNANSSSVSVTVTKITPTLSIGSLGCTYGEDLSLGGTLSVGSGKSVKIYQGETLIDTVTTTSNGNFFKSVSGLNAGTYQFTAVYDGDATYNAVTSSAYSATVSRLNTNLTINVPTLIYSDEFNVTGVLKDALNNPLSNMTVSLVWNDGSDHTVNATTGNDGSVTFHRSAPTSITEYTFQIGFTGTTNYGATSSSTVSKTPQKETTIINMTAPVSATPIISEGGTLTVSGALVTDDNEELSSKSIKISDGQTLLTTLTTDSNGAFSTTLSNLSVGTHTINIAFETDTYYTASSTSKTVNVVADILTLTSNKQVLSQADNDVATITATYNANDNSGKSVVFKNGDTVLDTVQTDSNGQASYTYASQGVGDVTITAECMSLIETYSIEDCWNTKLPEYSKSTSSTDVYSIGMDTVHNIQNDDFILEFDFKSNGYGGILCLGASNQWSDSNDTANYRLFMGNNDNSSLSLYYGYRVASTNNNNGDNRTADQYYNMKIVREGTSIKYYIDNTLIDTLSVSFLSYYSSWSIYGVGWGNGTIYFKNIRLKPL